jgi:formate dehydrogenase maturation protein FdhE
MESIEPCPFCGCDDVEQVNEEQNDLPFLRCCGCGGEWYEKILRMSAGGNNEAAVPPTRTV